MKLHTIAAIFLVLMLSACEKGPAERMGEKIDDAVTDTANAIEDACEEVRGAVDASNPNC